MLSFHVGCKNENTHGFGSPIFPCCFFLLTLIDSMYIIATYEDSSHARSHIKCEKKCGKDKQHIMQSFFLHFFIYFLLNVEYKRLVTQRFPAPLCVCVLKEPFNVLTKNYEMSETHLKKKLAFILKRIVYKLLSLSFDSNLIQQRSVLAHNLYYTRQNSKSVLPYGCGI